MEQHGNLDTILENSVLAQFLGMDNIEDLRQKVKEIILEYIRTDLEASRNYVITADDVREIVGDIIRDAVDEVKDEIREYAIGAVHSILMNPFNGEKE